MGGGLCARDGDVLQTGEPWGRAEPGSRSGWCCWAWVIPSWGLVRWPLGEKAVPSGQRPRAWPPSGEHTAGGGQPAEHL